MTQAGTLQKKRAKHLTDFLEMWYNQEFHEQPTNTTQQQFTLSEPQPPSYSFEDILKNELFKLYEENNKKAVIEYLKNHVEQKKNHPLLNIIDLWLGEAQKYQQLRSMISEILPAHKHAGIYIQESLVHYQYDWINQLFERFEDLREKFVPFYYATQILHHPASDLKTFVPEVMIETVQNILTYIKNRQNFYYGGK
jgi:hypothetical protein